MIITPPPGIVSDLAPGHPASTANWQAGFNVRFRMGQLESLGMFGPILNLAGAQVQLTVDINEPPRTLKTISTDAGAVILAGAANRITGVAFDPGSTPATGNRFQQVDLTPTTLVDSADTVPNPSGGTVAIPPVWRFIEDGEDVVAIRADVAEGAHKWNGTLASNFTEMNTPQHAVGGAMVNRILFLIGCDPLVPANASRKMTVRWSDRYNWEDWIPTDLNVSGEYQVSAGNRLMGGGNTSHGVAAWTDQGFYLFKPTNETEIVFDMKEVDTVHGLLSNNAWTEVEGVVFWIDQHRKLCRYSGGRVTVIQNPMKYISLENTAETNLPRVYMTYNVEYGEVSVWFPSEQGEEPNRALVINYLEQTPAWSYWALERTAFTPRFGSIPITGVDKTGLMYFHDLDLGLPSYAQPTGCTTEAPMLDQTDVFPVDWMLRTNIITPDDPSMHTLDLTELIISTLNSPTIGAEDDVFTVKITSFRDVGNEVDQSKEFSETYDISAMQTRQPIRASGRGIQLEFRGAQVKSVTRIGLIAAAVAEDDTVKGPR